MVTPADPATERRTPLSKERVLRAAVELADRDGIDGVSMRKLGQELGVEAMALYRHVRNKDDLLDGLVDAVIGEIERPGGTDDWQAALRELATAARRVMLRHPWASRLIVERPEVGPATLGHVDAVLGILLAAGFSLDLAHHTLHVLGSRIFGFTQDPFDDKAQDRPSPDEAARIAQAMAVAYPHAARLAAAASHDGPLGGCDDDVEFAFGLDLILEGLERRRGLA